MKKFVWLSHVGQSPRSIVSGPSAKGFGAHWLFLGQDYSRFLHWQEVLSVDYAYVPIKDELSQAVSILRKPFLDLIAELGRAYNSVAWWGSRVSERNTLVSALFLYCCYLRVFKQKLALLDGAILVVAEDWAILDSIAQIARSQNIEVKWVRHCPLFFQKSAYWLRAAGRIVKAILRGIGAKMAGTDFRPRSTDEGVVLIHTYVEETCFGPQEVFQDSYFPGLADWLEKQGQTVVMLPVLFNLKRSLFSAWQWFKKSKQNFLNPYFYYHWSDYAFVLKESWKQRLMPCQTIKLHELDVSRLFETERDRFLFGCLDSLLYYRLPLRLKQAGFNISQVIMPFENMMDEKLLILGIQKFFPGTKTTGFQHSVIYPVLLCQFILENEAEFAPYPDRVVCNGEFFSDIMIKGGIPRERVVIGPALRFRHLWERQWLDKIPETQKAGILVALPIDRGNMMEILIKVLKAFGPTPQLKILLKPHPMMSKKFLNDCSLIKHMPGHFQLVEGKMSEWIFKVKLMVSLGSGSIYEALAAGVPVLVVGREHALNFNPLDFYPNLNRVFFDPESIRAQALRLLGTEQERQEYAVYAREILRASFRPVTDEAMQVFLATEASL
jgi:hypothetical protein